MGYGRGAESRSDQEAVKIDVCFDRVSPPTHHGHSEMPDTSVLPANVPNAQYPADDGVVRADRRAGGVPAAPGRKRGF